LFDIAAQIRLTSGSEADSYDIGEQIRLTRVAAAACPGRWRPLGLASVAMLRFS